MSGSLVPCFRSTTDAWKPGSVESEGPYAPQELFLEAIAVMREKISVLKVAAESFVVQGIEKPASQPAVAVDGDIEMTTS